MNNSAIERRVLIVDDNIEAAELLQMLLDLEGYQTQIAYGGQEGLLLADSFKPNAVCSDVGMPGMSGLEFARHLRKNEHTKNALLIAISGWTDTDTRADTCQAGFDYHFAKPTPIDQISNVLHQFFQKLDANRGVS